MKSPVYYFFVFCAALFLLLLFGLAGASDTGAAMADILPRAVLYVVCFGLCCGLAHVTKNGRK